MLNANEMREAVARADGKGTIYVGDGSGLYLRFKNGRPYWTYSFRSWKTKRRTSISLGPYPAVPLRNARWALILSKADMWGLPKENITLHLGDDDLFSITLSEKSIGGLMVETERAMANLLESETVPPLDEEMKEKLIVVRKVLRNNLAWFAAIIKGPKVWDYADE